MMRIKEEAGHHLNQKAIHVDKKLAEKNYGDGNKDLEKKILAIHGVDSVEVHKYEVRVGKGDVFRWEEIMPQVTEILINHPAKYYSPFGEWKDPFGN